VQLLNKDYSGATQILSNGDFKTGSLSSWVRTTPNGNCGGLPVQVPNTQSHTGTNLLRDGINGYADQVSQQFTATARRIYVTSFW
jgi:hypothetical protein